MWLTYAYYGQPTHNSTSIAYRSPYCELQSLCENSRHISHMSGLTDIRTVWKQLRSPVQKHCLSAAGSHAHRTGLASRHIPLRQHSVPRSERHSRLTPSIARSSEDDRSNGQPSPDSNEQQGVGRKQVLKALSSKHFTMLNQLHLLSARGACS